MTNRIHQYDDNFTPPPEVAAKLKAQYAKAIETVIDQRKYKDIEADMVGISMTKEQAKNNLLDFGHGVVALVTKVITLAGETIIRFQFQKVPGSGALTNKDATAHLMNWAIIELAEAEKKQLPWRSHEIENPINGGTMMLFDLLLSGDPEDN